MAEYGPISDEYELMDAEDFKALLQVVRAAEKAIACCPFCQRGLECKNVHHALRDALEALPAYLRTVDKR